MKSLFSLILLSLTTFANLYSQSLIQEELSKEELRKGANSKYTFSEGEGNHEISLTLYNNRTYYYEETNNGLPRINLGSWKMVGNKLLLKENIDKNNIAIMVNYINKKDSTYPGIFQLVINLNNEIQNDAMVYVNTDSVQCLPLTGTCLGSFKTIQRVKLVFENGCTSGWISIKKIPFEQLRFIVQNKLSLIKYMPLKKLTYTKAKNSLVPYLH